MPKQNRPLVRGGRLQTGKKRTDRSYLRPDGQRAPAAPDAGPSDELVTAEPDAVAEILVEEVPAAAAASAAIPGRLPTSVSSMQQQGTRRRREVDLHALAVADTRYALHELRRIAILATAVVVTLVVLGIVLR